MLLLPCAVTPVISPSYSLPFPLWYCTSHDIPLIMMLVYTCFLRVSLICTWILDSCVLSFKLHGSVLLSFNACAWVECKFAFLFHGFHGFYGFQSLHNEELAHKYQADLLNYQERHSHPNNLVNIHFILCLIFNPFLHFETGFLKSKIFPSLQRKKKGLGIWNTNLRNWKGKSNSGIAN